MKFRDTSPGRLDWFRGAGFGLFIHWGPYSVAGVEASWPIMVPEWAWLGGSKRISQKRYENLAGEFSPTHFNADAWVKSAADAGMRYVIFTAKHHDGYCMFDAPGTDYKITNSVFGRDVVSELSEACARAGIRFGLYYSPPDMHHPGFRDTTRPARENWQGEPDRPEWASYLDYMEEHLRALLSRYGHISVIWFDGLFGQEKYNPERFHSLIHKLSPDTLVNDRLGDGGDYLTPEQGIPDGIPVREKEDFVPPEFSSDLLAKIQRALKIPIFRRIVRRKIREKAKEMRPLSPVPTEVHPDKANFLPWETCMTMNMTWGYCPTDKKWKSGALLIRTMAEVVSRGGNFLLNIGPRPDGAFPAEATTRLAAIGGWMDVFGEAIYGSVYGAVQGDRFIRTTERDGTVFAIVVDLPDDGIIRLDRKKTVSSVTEMSTGHEIEFSLNENLLVFNATTKAREDGLPPVYRID